MPIATNDTGETVFLDRDGQWKPAPTAVNPETKETLAFDGTTWSPLKPRAAPEQYGPPQPPPSRMDAFGRGVVQAGSSDSATSSPASSLPAAATSATQTLRTPSAPWRAALIAACKATPTLKPHTTPRSSVSAPKRNDTRSSNPAPRSADKSRAQSPCRCRRCGPRPGAAEPRRPQG